MILAILANLLTPVTIEEEQFCHIVLMFVKESSLFGRKTIEPIPKCFGELLVLQI